MIDKCDREKVPKWNFPNEILVLYVPLCVVLLLTFVVLCSKQ